MRFCSPYGAERGSWDVPRKSRETEPGAGTPTANQQIWPREPRHPRNNHRSDHTDTRQRGEERTHLVAVAVQLQFSCSPVATRCGSAVPTESSAGAGTSHASHEKGIQELRRPQQISRYGHAGRDIPHRSCEMTTGVETTRRNLKKWARELRGSTKGTKNCRKRFRRQGEHGR